MHKYSQLTNGKSYNMEGTIKENEGRYSISIADWTGSITGLCIPNLSTFMDVKTVNGNVDILCIYGE